MTNRDQILDERIEKYLAGAMTSDEALSFEQDLIKPEVSQAFGEFLMIRELLSSMGPDEPPQGLIEQIEEALEVQILEEQSSDEKVSGLQALLEGASWIVRGPAMAVQSPTSSNYGTSQAMMGLSNIGYALGPLANPIQGEEEPKAPPKKRPLWQRTLVPLVIPKAPKKKPLWKKTLAPLAGQIIPKATPKKRPLWKRTLGSMIGRK